MVWSLKADDPDARVGQSRSAACEPTLPKPCTIAVALAGSILSRVHRAERQIGDAAAGRLAPAEGAAGADRLAGDDLRHGDALVHRIGVHEPGHHLLVGAHVGRHDVGARGRRRGSSPACSGARRSPARASTARRDRPRRRPCRRRRAGRRARISSSSRSPAPRPRRGRHRARSACRPWSAPGSSDAARGSPGRRRFARRPCGSGRRRRSRAWAATAGPARRAGMSRWSAMMWNCSRAMAKTGSGIERHRGVPCRLGDPAAIACSCVSWASARTWSNPEAPIRPDLAQKAFRSAAISAIAGSADFN